MTEKPLKAKLMSNHGQAPILRHEAVTSLKHSFKYSRTLAGNRSWVALVQNQCSNHWAKVSTLMQLSEIDYKLEAMRNLPFVDI